MVFLIKMKKQLIVKNKTNSRLKCKTHTPFMTKMAKINAILLTKMAEIPYPLAGSARGGSGIPIYPEKNQQNTPKFLQIYPKIIEALNTLYPKLEVSETNTYLVVLPFLAFLQMDCHYFPTITDHKKGPHVSLDGKMVGYG